MGLLALDHVVVYVRDLKQASKQFERLGFHVDPGGDHGPTENALIAFEGSAYIELIAVKSAGHKGLFRFLNSAGISKWILGRNDNVMGRIFQWFSCPYGPVDWCIRLENGRQDLTGQEYTRRRPFSRQRPDGVIAKWTLFSPKNVKLPMFIEDITEPKLRKPEYRPGLHPNGARVIRNIVLQSFEIKAVKEQLGWTLEGARDIGTSMISKSELGSDVQFGLEITYSGADTHYIPPNQACGLPVWLVAE